jgi:hypothetical protein
MEGIVSQVFEAEANTDLNIRFMARFRLSPDAYRELVRIQYGFNSPVVWTAEDRLIGYPFIVDKGLSGSVVMMELDEVHARKAHMACLHRGHPVRTPKIVRWSYS